MRAFARYFLVASLLASTLAIPVAADAQTTEVQTARALGMGGAFRALAYDGSAVDLNPAGMAQVRRFEIDAGYRRDVFNRGYELDVMLVDALTSAATTGFAFQYRNIPEGRGGEPGADIQRYILGAAVPLIPQQLFLGTTTKFVRASYPGAVPSRGTRNILTGDLGVLYRPLQMLAVAATFDNLVNGVHPEAPRSITGGVAFLPVPWFSAAGDVFLDLASTDEEEFGWAVGTQLTVMRNIALRAGIHEDPLADEQVWTGGLGLISETGSIDYALRYASRTPDEGREIATHYVTISFYVF